MRQGLKHKNRTIPERRKSIIWYNIRHLFLKRELTSLINIGAPQNAPMNFFFAFAYYFLFINSIISIEKISTNHEMVKKKTQITAKKTKEFSDIHFDHT